MQWWRLRIEWDEKTKTITICPSLQLMSSWTHTIFTTLISLSFTRSCVTSASWSFAMYECSIMFMSIVIFLLLPLSCFVRADLRFHSSIVYFVVIFPCKLSWHCTYSAGLNPAFPDRRTEKLRKKTTSDMSCDRYPKPCLGLIFINKLFLPPLYGRNIANTV